MLFNFKLKVSFTTKSTQIKFTNIIYRILQCRVSWRSFLHTNLALKLVFPKHPPDPRSAPFWLNLTWPRRAPAWCARTYVRMYHVLTYDLTLDTSFQECKGRGQASTRVRFNRLCDPWRHMFTKRASEPDFLQAWFVHKPMEENIKLCILWSLQHAMFINLWCAEKGQISKLVQLLFVKFFTLFGNYGAKCKISHKTSVVFCLSARSCSGMYEVTLFVNKGHMVYM